jgi:hypothetical protein
MAWKWIPDLEQLKNTVKYVEENKNIIEPSFVSRLMNWKWIPNIKECENIKNKWEEKNNSR